MFYGGTAADLLGDEGAHEDGAEEEVEYVVGVDVGVDGVGWGGGEELAELGSYGEPSPGLGCVLAGSVAGEEAGRRRSYGGRLEGRDVGVKEFV